VDNGIYFAAVFKFDGHFTGSHGYLLPINPPVEIQGGVGWNLVSD